jgi:hypothetical protein
MTKSTEKQAIKIKRIIGNKKSVTSGSGELITSENSQWIIYAAFVSSSPATFALRVAGGPALRFSCFFK